MSFILDALKKLEQKRQHGSVPDLTTVHTTHQQSSKKRHLWPYLVVAALILNAGILAAVFYPRESEERSAASVPQSVTEQQGNNATLELEQKDSTDQEALTKDVTVRADVPDKKEPHVEKISKTPITTDEKPADEPALAAVDTNTDAASSPSPDIQSQTSVDDKAEAVEDNTGSVKTPPDAVEIQPAQDTMVSTRLDMSAQDLEILKRKIEEERAFPEEATQSASEGVEGSEADPEDTVLDFSQLPSEIKKELPDISISGHISSNIPGARLANINGHMVREGENVTRTLKVDEITMTGVIFSYQGFRFRMRAF
jgi:general secretion pathway protein B